MSPAEIKALGLLRGFEGCRLISYRDEGGTWSIGFGCTGPEIDETTIWTQEQADAELESRVKVLEGKVRTLIRAPISDGQVAACVSLAYNIGIGAFSHSTVLHRINVYDYKGAADAFLKWDEIHGVISEGLVNRRKDERAIFLQSTPVPYPLPPEPPTNKT